MTPALNPSWWHQRTRLEPLDALRTVAECLERRRVVPEPAASMVSGALRRYLCGDEELLESLSLRPARGKRSAVSRARTEQRNELLRQAFDRMGGATATGRAQALAELLHGTGAAPQEGLNAIVEALRRDHERLPQSGRQILRVVGER